MPSGSGYPMNCTAATIILATRRFPWVTDHWFYHSVETWGGVLEEDCAALLSDFFQRKR